MPTVGPDEGEGRFAATVRSANWPDDGQIVRELFRSYRAWLVDHRDPDAAGQSRADAGLALVDGLLDALPKAYQPPRGDILLWRESDRVVACGALRELTPGVGEIKRVAVVPEYRGRDFGRIFIRALLARAEGLGFRVLRVDTLPSMSAAIEFYREAGFGSIPAYWPHPAAGALFFERRLGT